MIIWFDNAMAIHVDKQHDANNSFALAKYVPAGFSKDQVVFKANAVVNRHTLLLTHTQVTKYAVCLAHSLEYCCSSTMRKRFFNKYLSHIEKSIANVLRIDKKYNGDIKLRFRVGVSAQYLFPDYGVINREGAYDEWNYHYADYLILEKSI